MVRKKGRRLRKVCALLACAPPLAPPVRLHRSPSTASAHKRVHRRPLRAVAQIFRSHTCHFSLRIPSKTSSATPVRAKKVKVRPAACAISDLGTSAKDVAPSASSLVPRPPTKAQRGSDDLR